MADTNEDIKSGHKRDLDLPSCYHHEKCGPAPKRIKKIETTSEDNNERKSTLNPSPQEMALKNHLVVRNILKYLPYVDLLTCRSVDLPYWTYEAEREIPRRLILSISVKSQIHMKKVFRCKKDFFQFKSISELSLNLSMSKKREKHPEIWLTIFNKDVDSEDLKNFLIKFGKFICRLDLRHWSGNNMSPSDFQQLLCFLPNLSHLTLGTVPSAWKYNMENFLQQWDLETALPQIYSFSFGNPYFYYTFSPYLLEALFQTMPNLNYVHKFPLDFIYPVNSVLLSSLKMVDLRFKLLVEDNSLSFWESFCQILSTAYQSYQNTVECLMMKPFSLPQLLEYPEMRAVKKIRLLCTDKSNYTIDPKIINLNGKSLGVCKTFPSLSEVTLEGSTNFLDQFLRNLTENPYTQNYFHGVISLRLQVRDCSEKALNKIASLFPDLTSLFIDLGVCWLEKNLNHIFWLWPQLISLKFKVHGSPFSNATSQKYFLDPVFTGLSTETCAKLRKHKEKRMDIYYERKTVGISTMKDLKELTLIFHGRLTEVIPLFSHVTPLYGFQCVPDLQVTFAIPWNQADRDKIQEMLSPVEKYVVFDSGYYERLEYYERYLM